jgi:arginyl-tRNA synthetase
MYVQEKFRTEIENLLKKEGIKEIKLEKPPEGIKADLAFPCFELARQKKRNPVEIAKELKEKIEVKGLVKEIKAEGPYLNFYINHKKSNEEILKNIIKMKDKYGKGLQKEKIMVEFSQPNPHKAFHIGHLRNTVLGDSLIRILKYSGNKVVSSNYINDTGMHVAKCLWAYERFFKNKKPKENKGRWLGEIYSYAAKKMNEKEEYNKEINDVLEKIESKDPEIIKLWKKTRKWSLDEFRRIYKELGVSFDVWFYDSDLGERGKQVVNELLKKKIARKSEGAIIVDLEKYGLGIALILKTGGTTLYITKDFALAEEKFRKYKIDKSIYVTGSEQRHHFSQLFKILELSGFKQAKKCKHISYGLISLKEGKMSSREGNVILYETLLEKMSEKALKETKKRHKEWGKNKLEYTSKIIAIGALKYGMLNISHNRNIVFDWQSALSLEGNTAPYLQYSYVRASSILRKQKLSKFDAKLLKEKEEISLISKLSEFPLMVEKASLEYSPHIIANYLFELSQLFNLFYEKHQVLKAGKGLKEARLALVKSTAQVLNNGITLLRIEILKKM